MDSRSEAAELVPPRKQAKAAELALRGLLQGAWLARPESTTAHGFHRPRLLLFAFAPLLASSTNAEARELRICADTNRHRGRSSDQRKADTPDNVADADADLVAGAVEVQCGPAIADRQVVHCNMI